MSGAAPRGGGARGPLCAQRRLRDPRAPPPPRTRAHAQTCAHTQTGTHAFETLVRPPPPPPHPHPRLPPLPYKKLQTRAHMQIRTFEALVRAPHSTLASYSCPTPMAPQAPCPTHPYLPPQNMRQPAPVPTVHVQTPPTPTPSPVLSRSPNPPLRAAGPAAHTQTHRKPPTPTPTHKYTHRPTDPRQTSFETPPRRRLFSSSVSFIMHRPTGPRQASFRPGRRCAGGGGGAARLGD